MHFSRSFGNWAGVIERSEARNRGPIMLGSNDVQQQDYQEMSMALPRELSSTPWLEKQLIIHTYPMLVPRSHGHYAGGRQFPIGETGEDDRKIPSTVHVHPATMATPTPIYRYVFPLFPCNAYSMDR
jgi:hypothetical protein